MWSDSWIWNVRRGFALLSVLEASRLLVSLPWKAAILLWWRYYWFQDDGVSVTLFIFNFNTFSLGFGKLLFIVIDSGEKHNFCWHLSLDKYFIRLFLVYVFLSFQKILSKMTYALKLFYRTKLWECVT